MAKNKKKNVDVKKGIENMKNDDLDDLMDKVDSAFEETIKNDDIDTIESNIEENVIKEDKNSLDEEKEKELETTKNLEREKAIIEDLQVKENKKISTSNSDKIYHPEVVKKHNSIKKKESKNIFPTLFAIIAMAISIIYFGLSIVDNGSSIHSIINALILSLFTIVYLVVCITFKRKSNLIIISSLLLIFYFIFNFNTTVDITGVSSNKVKNFSGTTLTEVVKWASKNNIKITQEYEYSDMVPEYEIISQNVVPGTYVNDIDEIIVSVSEGPNPFKEIIVPSMLGWDSERVINYVLSNYLNNVIVEFVESDAVKDTVIEQNRSGNLRRNEELKLVFSYGDLGNSDSVTLIDFTNKTKFEAEFYMKQHKLNYYFEDDFSDTIKKGYIISQGIAAGKVVNVNGDKVKLVVSKGPKIEIPDLTSMSVEKITEWAITNRLKLEFVDSYDDTVKKGKVISVDREKGEIVEQGTQLKITVSLGSLKMPSFKTVDDFYTWADKYGIKYEVRREFSDTVPAGGIINFSYKKGQAIKNNDAIVITISDGVKVTVPDVVGLTKSGAISKLNKANLNYNIVYRNSTAAKDKVIAQSISAGSEVSSGVTITITLSNGTAGNSSGGNNSGGNNSGGNNNGGSNNDTPTPSPSPTPECRSCTVSKVGLKKVIIDNAGSFNAVRNAIISYIENDSGCSGITINVYSQYDPDYTPGTLVEDAGSWSGGSTDTCSTVSFTLFTNQ